MIQYQILQTNIIRIVWLTLRRITKEICELNGLELLTTMKFIRVVIAVYFPITLQGFVNAFNDVTFEFILGTQTGTWKNNCCKLARNKCVDKLLIHRSRTFFHCCYFPDQLQINRVDNKYRYALSSTMKSLNN